MLIAIPSLGRADQKNHTFERLPAAVRNSAKLVVGKADRKAYADRFGSENILVTPAKGIGKVRQWIVERAPADLVCMLDDDLAFFERRKDDATKLLLASPASVAAMFKQIAKELKQLAHIGVAAREGANRCTDQIMFNTRMLRVLAYDTKVLHKEKVSYARLPVMEDFDVTLQLLRKGYANGVLNTWAQDQGTSNAPGGCSTYRTMEVQAEGAHGLKKLHAEYVTVVQKETKGAWGGGVRTDVRIAWKRAYEEGRNAA